MRLGPVFTVLGDEVATFVNLYAPKVADRAESFTARFKRILCGESRWN
jgi:hypothetical protein